MKDQIIMLFNSGFSPYEISVKMAIQIEKVWEVLQEDNLAVYHAKKS
jgi:hypothetical protein